MSLIKKSKIIINLFKDIHIPKKYIYYLDIQSNNLIISITLNLFFYNFGNI